MGKGSRRQQHRRRHGSDDELPSSAYDLPCGISSPASEEEGLDGSEVQDDDDTPICRHSLYQRAVQTPKGELSYCQKFFLVYVGGRTPLRLREDFCGTALICSEWVRGDTRRTAIGVDLDEDALAWGLEHNIATLKGDAAKRVQLFKQNVLHPISNANRFSPETDECGAGSDIICALNFSCCCLQSRKELVCYFKTAFNSLSSKQGGVFLMDLYGGSSSEQAVKLQRRYSDFLYKWEQEEFDVVQRTTRISLHFQLKHPKKALRNAFTYNWRLWTIPEIRDCLEEAGFNSTHVWLCEMPELRGRDMDDSSAESREYVQVESFKQCDAWNAYIVGVRPKATDEHPNPEFPY